MKKMSEMSLIEKLNHFAEENMSVDEVLTALRNYSMKIFHYTI
jgi:hypothetical protein